MARVFISHSSRDGEPATRIKAWLQEQGFETPFLDFDKHAGIPPGADWEKTLYREIEQSEAIIIIQTPNWLDSKWCFAEYTQARALGKAIFPVIETPTGDTLIASDIQALNLLNDREGGLEQLLKELTRIAVDAQGGFPWDSSRPPYPGLHAFQEEDAALYFGRDDDIRRLIERLNARRAQGGTKLIALLGASGSGKSSLLRAGVIPRIKRDKRNWIILPPMRPQAHPVDELARVIAIALKKGADWRSWRDQLSGPDLARTLSDLASDLRMQADANEAQILIPIDQGEELFGASEPDDADRFFEILNVAMSEDLPYLAVLAQRSDYLEKLQSAEKLTARFEEFSLPPLPLSRIPQIIEGPARVAGLGIEEGLVLQAAKDAETEDALPLLAFALRELFDRYADDNYLSLDEYHALGDPKEGLTPLENAVRKAADDVLTEARPGEEELTALREAFVPAMVRVNDKGEYVRQPARWDELPAKAHPLLERLAKARLLVISQDGEARMVEVAHEALLRKWPRLRDWLDDAREFLTGRQQLERDLHDWQRATEAEKAGALLTGLKLNRARGWLLERPHQLTAQERTFVQASIDHAEAEENRKARTRRNITRASIAASLVLAVVAGLAGWQWLEANESARLANAATIEAKQSAAVAKTAQVEAVAQKDLAEKQKTIAEEQKRQAEQEKIRADTAKTEAEKSAFAAKTARKDALEQKDEATRQRDQAMLRQSQLLATHARQENARENFGNGLLLALAALAREDGSERKPFLLEAKVQLHDAVSRLREHSVLAGHEDRVTYAVFSADGERLVTASHDKTARIWDAQRGVLLTTLSGHKARVTHAEFSPSGRLVATASGDGTARLWDVGTGELRHTLQGFQGDGDEVYHVSFSPDGKRLVTASSWKGAVLWDTGNGQVIAVLPVSKDREGSQYVVHARFSPDGKRIVTSDRFAGIGRLWDGRTGRHLKDLIGHKSGHFYATFSPNGQRILTASADKTARLWNSTTGAMVAVLRGHSGKVFHAEFSPDGTRIVTTSSDHTARLWTGDGKPLEELKAHDDEVRHAAFSPTGGLVVTVARDDKAYVWDVESGDQVATLSGHFDDVTHVTFSPDGQRLATTGDRTARLWQIANDSLVKVLAGHESSVKTAVFSPDGSRLVTTPGGWVTLKNRSARLWDVASGRQIAAIMSRDVQDAAFSPKGTYLAVASHGLISIRAGRTGAKVRDLFDARGRLMQVAFSPDERLVAAVSASFSPDGGDLRIWDVESGRQVAAWNTKIWLFSLAWSPDGKRVLVDGSHLWDVDKRRITATYEKTRNASAANATAFSSDGLLVLTARGNTARLWNAETGELFKALDGHTGRIISAAFSPNGRRVLTTSADSTARLWSVPTGEPLVVFEEHVDMVNHGAFSADGRRVVTGAGKETFYRGRKGGESDDNRALVWDAETGHILAQLEGHAYQVRHVAFNVRGDLVATASEDKTVRLWHLFPNTTALIDYARRVAPRQFTPEQRKQFGLGE